MSDPPGRGLLSRMLRSRCRSLHSCAAQYRRPGEYRFDVADNVVGAVGLCRNWREEWRQVPWAAKAAPASNAPLRAFAGTTAEVYSNEKPGRTARASQQWGGRSIRRRRLVVFRRAGLDRLDDLGHDFLAELDELLGLGAERLEALAACVT